MCARHEIGTIDQKRFIPEKAIGIEDIRILQETLSLTPLKHAQKALILYQADTMSIASQNALLKTLEEPPQHTIIMLVASKKESFLPTILSRCTLIEDQRVVLHLDKKDYDDYKALFSPLDNNTTAKQLIFAQTFGTTKENTLTWLEKAIVVARENLLATHAIRWVSYIRQFQKMHTLLSQTNANPRLALEHMFFSLDKKV